MKLPEKITHIRENCFHQLNAWEREFIDEMHEIIIDLSDNPTEQEVEEFLTRRQKEKIEEIWEKMGL